MHVITTADGPVTPVGVEQRVEALDGVAAAAVVGVGPAGTQQVVVVVVEPTAAGCGGAGARLALAEPARPPPSGAPRRVPRRRRAASPTRLPVDIRHASKVDRTPGRPLGRAGAGRRARPGRGREGPGHRGERHARRRRRRALRRPAATTSPCCSAARRGCGLPRGARRRRRPRPPSPGRRRGPGRRRAPRRQGRRRRAGGRSSPAPTSTGTRTVVDACRARGRGAGSCTSPRPSVAHAGRAAGRRAAPGRPTPPRPRALRPQQGGGRAAGARRRRGPTACAVVAVRPHLVWGPGDTQLVGRHRRRAPAPGRLPVVGSGAALIDTTYVDNAVDALVAALDRCAAGARARPWWSPTASRARSPSCSPRICRGRRRRRAPRAACRTAVAGRPGPRSTAVWAAGCGPATGDPPMTRFLAEQLSHRALVRPAPHARRCWAGRRASASTRGWPPWPGPDRDGVPDSGRG